MRTDSKALIAAGVASGTLAAGLAIGQQTTQPAASETPAALLTTPENVHAITSSTKAAASREQSVTN